MLCILFYVPRIVANCVAMGWQRGFLCLLSPLVDRLWASCGVSKVGRRLSTVCDRTGPHGGFQANRCLLHRDDLFKKRFLMHRDSFQGLLDSHYSHLTVSHFMLQCHPAVQRLHLPGQLLHENASPSFRQWHVQCFCCLCFGKSLLHNVNKTPIQSAAFGCWIGPNFGEIRADPVF